MFGVIGLGVALFGGAQGQVPETAPDTSEPWHDDAWTPIVEQEGVRIDYIYYPEANNEHDGIVVRLTNENDVPVRYAFTLIFRAPEAETTATVRGRLNAGQMKTGDKAGLFWIPFTDQDRSLGEIGLRGLEIWPARKPRPGQSGST
jgi:hypothetical protein